MPPFFVKDNSQNLLFNFTLISARGVDLLIRVNQPAFESNPQ
jgi:hypothetical protein